MSGSRVTAVTAKKTKKKRVWTDATTNYLKRVTQDSLAVIFNKILNAYLLN